MSYCRWSGVCRNGRESDAYIYEDVHGKYVCHWKDGTSIRTPIDDLKGFIEEVRKKSKSDNLAVPEYAYESLNHDLINP